MLSTYSRLELMLGVVLIVAALLFGCRAVGEQRPAVLPTVTVSQPIQRDVTPWGEYSGYLSAPETAIVSARVSGLLVEAPFREGSLIHRGDLLFKLDPRPFQ